MGQEDLTREEMLSQFLTRAKTLKGSSSSKPTKRRKGVHPPASVGKSNACNESDILGGDAQEQAEKALDMLQDRNKVQLKLLQFESDRRQDGMAPGPSLPTLSRPVVHLALTPFRSTTHMTRMPTGKKWARSRVKMFKREKRRRKTARVRKMMIPRWTIGSSTTSKSRREEEQLRAAAANDNAMDIDDDDIVEVDAKGTPVPASAPTTNLLHPKKKKKVKLLVDALNRSWFPFRQDRTGRLNLDNANTPTSQATGSSCSTMLASASILSLSLRLNLPPPTLPTTKQQW